MAFIFKDWFFRQLPEYAQLSDSNKDELDQGTLQRYLQIFGMETDENIMPYVTDFMDVIDLQKTDDKYLPMIAGLLGNPPSLGDNASYRKVLAYALAIYKVKGTKKSYEIFMNLLGLRIDIIEDIPAKQVSYDLEPDIAIYDEEPIMNQYDSECDYCSGYTIAYSSNNDTYNPMNLNTVPPETLAKINNILCFLQPINAQFKGLIRSNRFGDNLTPEITVGSTGNQIPTGGSFTDETGANIFVIEDLTNSFQTEP